MYAYKQGTQWVIYDDKSPLPLDGGTESYSVPSNWSDYDKQMRFGLYVVLEDVVTDGMVEVSRQLIDQSGHPRLAKVLAPITITSDMVNEERDRRTYAGFMFQGKMYDFDREKSKPNISGAGTLAFMAVVAGAKPGDLYWHGGVDPFAWIAHDNNEVPMDAQTVIAFGKTASAWEMGHIFAARNLKLMNPIPADYTSDAYWPPLA